MTDQNADPGAFGGPRRSGHETYGPPPGVPGPGVTGERPDEGATGVRPGSGSTGVRPGPGTTGARPGSGTTGPTTTGGQEATPVADEARMLAGQAADSASQVGSTAVDRAAEVKDTAVERGADVVDVAKDELAELTHQARTHARQLWTQASGQVREQADTGRRQLAELVHSLSSELGEMASKSTQDGPVTALARQAAARGGALSHWLSNTDASGVLVEVRRFARRRPWAFLGGAVVAGVVVGRLGRGLMAADDEPRTVPGSATSAGAMSPGTSGTAALASPTGLAGTPNTVGAVGPADEARLSGGVTGGVRR